MYKRNKFNAKKRVVDGIKFDSVAESIRYEYLKILEEDSDIERLELQPTYVIQDKQEFNVVEYKTKWGKEICTQSNEKIRALNYKADFRYYVPETDIYVIEDVKGCQTDLYIAKKKLILDDYIYGNIVFREVFVKSKIAQPFKFDSKTYSRLEQN